MAAARRKLEIDAGHDGILVAYSDFRLDSASRLRLCHADGVIVAVVEDHTGRSELACGHASAEMSALMRRWSTVIMSRMQGASGIALGEIPLEHI